MILSLSLSLNHHLSLPYSPLTSVDTNPPKQPEVLLHIYKISLSEPSNSNGLKTRRPSATYSTLLDFLAHVASSGVMRNARICSKSTSVREEAAAALINTAWLCEAVLWFVGSDVELF